MEKKQTYINKEEIVALLKNLYIDETQITQMASYLVGFYEHADELADIFSQHFTETVSSHTKLLVLNLMHELITISMNDTNEFVEAFGKNMLNITNTLV